MNTTATLNKKKMSHAIINGFKRGKKPVPKFWLVTRVARVFKTNHRVPEVKRVHDARLRNKEGGRGGRNSNTYILSLFKTIATFQKVTWAIFHFLLQLPLLMSLKIVKSSLFIVLYNINSSCKNPSVLPSNWHKFQANCDKNRPTAFIVDMENKRSHCR